MRVLESFLIALGIKVDEKSFQKADAAFGGLTKSALQFGAVLASKLAIDKVVGDFKDVGTQMENFHRLTGLSTQKVQSFGQALAAMGGNASDALGTFQKVQELMRSPITGKIEWAADAAKYGIDPDVIIKAKSTEEALANIAGEMEKLPLLQKRLAGQAMGFSDGEINVLIKGRAELEKQLDVRNKLGIMTDKQVEDAARLTKANSDLNLVFTDMGNTIGGELTPALTEMAEEFVSFYRANKDLVDSGLKEFFGGVADNIELAAAAMALLGGASALKGLAALKSLLGLQKTAPPATPVPTNGPGGIPLIARAGIPLAALFYSSKLNEGEDEELLKNRMNQGGAQAAGPMIDYLRSKGVSETLAKGMTANMQKESGFRADAVGDGGNAYGLLQWHPDRQSDFAKFSGKEIRGSSIKDQADFAIYEATKGKERENWKKVQSSQNAYEAAAAYSKYVIRPADREGEADERGRIAESYGGSSPTASTAPEVTDEQLTKLRAGYGKPEQPQEGFLDQTKSWLDSYRKPPREYSVDAVVQPPAKAAEAPSQQAMPAAATPAYNDNRQFHIHGADTEKVKQLYNEQLSGLTESTMEDFRSPER